MRYTVFSFIEENLLFNFKRKKLNFKKNQTLKIIKMKKGMTKVSVMYPSNATSNFNMDYYLSSHIPMVAKLLGESVKGASVEKGLEGQPYMAIGTLYFESVDAFQNAFGPQTETIMADAVNYTNVEPVLQISEVLM